MEIRIRNQCRCQCFPGITECICNLITPSPCPFLVTVNLSLDGCSLYHCSCICLLCQFRALHP